MQLLKSLQLKNKTPLLRGVRGVLYNTLLFVFLSVSLNAQEQYQVRSAIDSTSIEMGSVINYAIQVEDNKGKLVVFPEGDSFSPLEVIKSFKTDTLDENGKYRLLKQYALTQFDSGHYTIPRQKVVVAGKTFYTDSLKVEVRDIVVDTSKQKLYPIKGIQAVEDISETDWTSIIFWILGILIIVGLIAFLFWKLVGKKMKLEEKLPAFDRAVQALQGMEVDNLIEEKKYKKLYSELTDIAKGYLEEEITDHALESTTDELIANLNALVKKGKLSISKDTLDRFEATLKTADFAKFAAVNPPEETAKADKELISEFIQKVEVGKPELTEEEKLQNEEYRLAQEKKLKIARQRKTIIVAIIALIAGVITFFAARNYESAMDYVLSRTGNSLLRKNWITSTYGVPGVQITTPEVLTRQPVKLEGQQQQMMVGNQIYLYGELLGKFYVMINTATFRQDIGFKLENASQIVTQGLESQKATDIIIKDEDFETIDGIKGKKVYGTLNVKLPKAEAQTPLSYTYLVFGGEKEIQQIAVLYDGNDSKATEVMKRIINSVEIKKSEN